MLFHSRMPPYAANLALVLLPLWVSWQIPCVNYGPTNWSVDTPL